VLAADLDELRAAEPGGILRLLPAFDTYAVAVAVEIEPFGRLGNGVRAAAEAEAQRLAAFLDGELDLSWTTP
jgi:hypothetical protein